MEKRVEKREAEKRKKGRRVRKKDDGNKNKSREVKGGGEGE